MSNSPLVNAILDRLHEAGYRDLAAPFHVATVKFDFTAAVLGTDGRALDLVLVVDTTTGEYGDRDGAQVRQRVEALGRALDVTESRYVVTVILAGAALGRDMEYLAESCRVLHVDGLPLDPEGELENDAARKQLEDRIRVLLPLTLPSPLAVPRDGSGPAMDQLVRALPDGVDRTLLEALTGASQEGDQAVTEAMASVLGAALVMGKRP